MKNKIIGILLKYPIIFYSIYFVYILRPAFKNLYPKELDFLINGFSGILLIWGLIIIEFTHFSMYFSTLYTGTTILINSLLTIYYFSPFFIILTNSPISFL